MIRDAAVVTAAHTRTSNARDLDALWRSLTQKRNTDDDPESHAAETVSSDTSFEFRAFACSESRTASFASLFEEAISCAADHLVDCAGPTAVVLSSIMGSRSDADWTPLNHDGDRRIDEALARDVAHLGLRIPGAEVIAVGSGCAAGTSALGTAATLVEGGEFAAVAVIGVEALSLEVLTLFRALSGLATDGHVRPFDHGRTGMLPGEGWGVLIVQPRSMTTPDNTHVVVAGYGEACDGYDLAAPDPNGSGLRAAIGQAMDRAAISPRHLGWVCGHGTGTLANDALEGLIYDDIFSERRAPLPVVSIKGVTGHTQGAAGVIEAAVAVRSLQKSVVPANPTLIEVDDRLVDAERTCFPTVSQQLNEGGRVLSTSFGFGGAVAAVVLASEGGHQNGRD